jgi:hypothetical protein
MIAIIFPPSDSESLLRLLAKVRLKKLLSWLFNDSFINQNLRMEEFNLLETVSGFVFVAERIER